MCPAYPADPERSLPPVRLRYVHPPRRPCPVRAAVNPCVKVPKVLLELPAVVLPRDAVHPRRGLRPKREVRRPQTVNVNMVQERGELRFLVRCCHSAYATKLTERAMPGTASGARFASRVSLGWPPSLHDLRRPALGVVRPLHRYYATIRLLTIVHHGITAIGVPRTTRPTITTGG